MSGTVRMVEVGPDRALVTVERPAPEPGTDQVLVEVAYCGICGSDLHFRDVPELFPAGTVPGHELTGRIAALGPGVRGWSVGDRVCVLPFGQCGDCDVCRAGHEQVCPQAIPNGVGLGTGRPGGYAERLVVDETMLFALPDGLDDRAGALVEPLAVAVRAIAKADLDPSEPVAVLGAGSIGLLTGLVLREQGFRRFVVVSRNSARTARATALGLPTLPLDEAERGVAAALEANPACVFECAGTPAAARLAVELVRPLGQVILVGIALEPLDLAAPPLVLREVELRGSLTYRRTDFARAIELLAQGRVSADELITGTAALDEAEAIFRSLVAPGNTHVKVLLSPRA
jgi:(R,R)-butanediol dehydrogenase / meso-butanediol dehydrogenase / diacetyl reductase